MNVPKIRQTSVVHVFEHLCSRYLCRTLSDLLQENTWPYCSHMPFTQRKVMKHVKIKTNHLMPHREKIAVVF